MVHQPFPKWRYHQDGRSLIVQDPADEAARTPDFSGWQDQPFRDDGPTLEAYVEAGYPKDKYPPRGFVAKPSPAWTQLQTERTLAPAAAPPPSAPVPLTPIGIPEPPVTTSTESASVLDGTVEQVATLVGSILSKDTLEQLKTGESAGKNRKGVLAAIDAQLSQLAK